MARVVGGAETAFRYLVDKLPLVPATTETVSRECVGTIRNSVVAQSKPMLGGEEIYKLLKPALDLGYAACTSDEICNRAKLRTFSIAASVAGSVALACSSFVSSKLSNVAILSSLSRGADEIIRWSVKDGFQESTTNQTLFALLIMGTSATTAACCLKAYYGKHPYFRKWKGLVTSHLIAGVATAVVIGEFLALHNRAVLENSCLKQ